jgi:long-chain fatty acid transport protein
MSSTQGRLDITGTANIFNVEQSQLRHEVDATLTAVRYPQLGARVAVSRRAALAVVYRGQFSLELDLHARLLGDISQLTTAYYALQSYSINAFLPQQVVFGASWEPVDHLRVNADLTWVQWSAYVAPVAQLDVDLNIPPPQGGWPAGITPPTSPARTRIEPLKLHDRVIPRVGVEWQFLDAPHWQAFARGGYEYSKTPFPAQIGLTNYIDRDRHSVSLGAGVRWVHPGEVLRGDVRFDVHAQWSVLTEQLTVKSDPADLVGDYTAGGHLWNLGLSTTVGF